MPEVPKDLGGKNQHFEPVTPHELKELVTYAHGSIVSRIIIKKKTGNMTLFSFDAGQELSEHTSPFDAFVYALDGKVRLTIGGKTVTCAAGQIVHMPANVPHAVFADEKFKMLLIMIRNAG